MSPAMLPTCLEIRLPTRRSTPARIKKSLPSTTKFYPSVHEFGIGHLPELRSYEQGGTRTLHAKTWTTGGGFLST